MISYNDCVKLGMIKKVAPSAAQANTQMEKSQTLFNEAKTAIKTGSPNAAVLAGYASMFDAARALLFRDGFRERSHACVARYLEANYSEKLGMSTIHMLDEHREKRHKVTYSSEYYPTLSEAKELVAFAEEFLKKISFLLDSSR